MHLQLISGEGRCLVTKELFGLGTYKILQHKDIDKS